MKSLTKISKVFLKGILLSVFINCFTNSVLAQSVFNRNDNYDFTGLHYLAASGYDINNFNLSIKEDNSDFRKFKLHIRRSHLHLSTEWSAIRVRVDMNNDGVWEQNWTPYQFNEVTVSYVYPNPTGISANHTIKVEIDYYNYGSGSVYRIKYLPVTIYPSPRVYVDSDNNSFIQLRNEDATWKIPVLMVEGFDPVNEKFPEVYYNLTWELINSDLYPSGYEVFILNFNNGGRDLQLNAEVLLKAIEKVHEICPNYKIALAGLSMGGPIGRYALAKKEDEGGVHHVGLFLSYDSPQQAIHVSPDLQDWIKEQNPSDATIAVLQTNLQSDAAKQMLSYNTYDPNPPTVCEAFYNELNALNGDGYPHQCYNVAVSNGNFEAYWGYEQIGRHLLTFKVGDLITSVNAVKLDCAAGSLITDITMRRYGDIYPIPYLPFISPIPYEMEINFNPAYNVTWSGLDLIGWDDDEQTGDITTIGESKFDDYVVQETSVQHHVLTDLTRTTIMDWLNMDFDVTINYDLPEGGTVSPDNYQVQILHGLHVYIEPKTVNVNGQQITYTFQYWEDGSTQNPRTFYTSHDVSHTVTMKGLQVSNDVTAYNTNSQRKIVRLENTNYLLNVYKSLNHKVWLEQSNDNGQTWVLKNNGAPLDNANPYGSSPSIDYIPLGLNKPYAVIVHNALKLSVVWADYTYTLFTQSLDFSPALNTEYIAPVVAVTQNHILVVYDGGLGYDEQGNEQVGLAYLYGTVSYNPTSNPPITITWTDGIAPNWKVIPGTTRYSKNPTIMADKDGNTFHIAWEDGKNIKYRNVIVSGNNLIFSDLVTPSIDCGYSQYYSPSIVVMENDNLARLCWVGRRYICLEQGDVPCIGDGFYQYKVLFKGLNNLGRYWAFGGENRNSVSSPNINKKNDNSSNPYYAFAWYESSGENKFADNTLSTVRTLNTVGQRVQVINGQDKDNMFAMSFNYNYCLTISR